MKKLPASFQYNGREICRGCLMTMYAFKDQETDPFSLELLAEYEKFLKGEPSKLDELRKPDDSKA